MAQFLPADPSTNLDHIFHPRIEEAMLLDPATYFSRWPRDIIRYCLLPYLRAVNWSNPTWVGDLVFFGNFKVNRMTVIRSGLILVSTTNSIFRLLNPRTGQSRDLSHYPYEFDPVFHYEMETDTLYLQIIRGGPSCWTTITHFSQQKFFRHLEMSWAPFPPVVRPSAPVEQVFQQEPGEPICYQIFNDHLISLTTNGEEDDHPIIRIYRCVN